MLMCGRGSESNVLEVVKDPRKDRFTAEHPP